jgi:uncharacterized glyoxalase superfamily protein PhnB
MAAKPIPDGFTRSRPISLFAGRPGQSNSSRRAFGAEILGEPMKRPDGLVMHTEIKIGDSRVMISDASEQHPPMPTMLYLYVPDCDAVFKRAVSAGGTSIMEPADQFYGDRSGGVKDPAGNHWFIGTHKEDVAPQELKRRAEAHHKAQQGKAA